MATCKLQVAIFFNAFYISIIMLRILFILLPFTGFCQTVLNAELVNKLAAMPLHCIGQQWPNKTSHTSDSSTDHMLLPKQLHPSFYGCLDWHSSVHGHWMLVKLLKEKPGFALASKAREVLANSFEPEKIIEEAKYFSQYKTSKIFERTYGWAWLLQLDAELKTWNDPQAKEWHESLQPLTKTIVTLWKNFLPKQTYPNRTGVHPNTAFGMCFALDWAKQNKDTAFEKLLAKNAKTFYLANVQIPAWLEPDGTDFFSPSLEAADLMQRILSRKQFVVWLEKYYSPKGINNVLKMPTVSDRKDYQIVHLDGLSLSRSWCLRNISRALPKDHQWKKLFAQKANEFLVKTLPNVTSGNYGGDHWLATFAVYALF